MQPYNNHCKNPLYHRFDAHVCPICGHSLYEKSSTSINTAPSAAKTLFLVFLAVIMQISWIVFVFLMLFAPFAQAIPSLSAPAHICTSEGHDNMLTATHDGKCPAPIHAPLTHHDKACLDHAAGKTPSIWDFEREATKQNSRNRNKANHRRENGKQSTIARANASSIFASDLIAISIILVI